MGAPNQTPQPAAGKPPVGSPPSAPVVGQVVAERYRIERVLGEGAMGAVYLAEHVHMRKRYAMKILHPEIASPEIIARFEREAIAAANITHPGIAAATDFGRLEEGGFFLVLEYVAGQDLRHTIKEGAMHPKRALALTRQILLALGAAHAKGVIHRDIKPENVMLVKREDGEDQVKVLDFGIAKVDSNAMGDGENAAVLTRMGAVYGTPAYMSPEQALGTAVDARVDLYAVGIMLFEMIAGAPPFEGDGIIVIAKQVNEPLPPLTSPSFSQALTPELHLLVESLLAKERDDRPADAPAALALLDRADESLPHDSFASAATAFGEMQPATRTPKTPPFGSVATLRQRVAALAKRIGVSEMQLVVFAISGAAALLLLVIIIAVRPGKPSEEEDGARRPRRHHMVTGAGSTSASPSTPSSDSMGALPPSTDPSTDPSGTAAGASTAGGGRKKGGSSLGNKIKSIFH